RARGGTWAGTSRGTTERSGGGRWGTPAWEACRGRGTRRRGGATGVWEGRRGGGGRPRSTVTTGIGRGGGREGGSWGIGRGGAASGGRAGGGRGGGSEGGVGGSPGGTTATQVYGDYRDPAEPGSGGAQLVNLPRRGGNGGGLVRITAGRLELDGSILANGGG